jgi:tetratricopeptide (TPR) repeat protein
MARVKRNGAIDDLFKRGRWSEARRLLERERTRDPENHWVLTQLGVTFYEQQRYEEALLLFAASLEIVPDCPLTLWNVAGTLDALGKPAQAVSIYTWLLRSDKSPADDPCWESKQWTDVLKADCAYRLGASFTHLGKKQKARNWYLHYLDLLSAGLEGSYSLDDVQRRLRDLRGSEHNGAAEREIRKALQATMQAAGAPPRTKRPDAPPKLDVAELVGGRHK